VIALVVAVLAVLVIAAIVWARVGAARSEHKSVETYEHALDVLGEVSKRTEHTAFRILPHEETGRPHVGRRIDPAGGEVSQGRMDVGSPGEGQLVARRLPPAGEPKLRFSGRGRPAVDEPEVSQEAGDQGRDDRHAGAKRGAPPATASGAAVHTRPASDHAQVTGTAEAGPHRVVYRSSADRHRQVIARRAATGVAAAAAVAAVVVAAIFLAGGGAHHATTVPPVIHHPGGSRLTTTTTTTATTTTLPTRLKPTSVSLSNVAFTVPSATYTLRFQATGGLCWVGVEHTTAGPWLFAETLGSGQSATYKGSGALIVRLGAPAYIGLTVNGLVAELPSGLKQTYSVDLTPGST
jgi:hypothetical protein